MSQRPWSRRVESVTAQQRRVEVLSEHSSVTQSLLNSQIHGASCRKKPCLVYNDSLGMGLEMQKVLGHRPPREPNVNTEMPSKKHNLFIRLTEENCTKKGTWAMQGNKMPASIIVIAF